MQEYYNRRAVEYEAKYHRDEPVRLTEQEAIMTALRSLFHKRRVLELACGTGYWTQGLAQVAAHVVGVDASAEMLDVARSKGLDPAKVELVAGDVYALDDVSGDFDAGVANFWFSHIPKSQVDAFIRGFHARLGPGSPVFLADDVFVPGVGGEPVTPGGSADAYKLRTLADGSQHMVLKNYYSEADLDGIFAPVSNDLRIYVGRFHWWLSYTVA